MIDAFFKFLNFGIFIGLGIYAWRRNLHKFFQNLLTKKRIKTEELVREEYAVLRAQESIKKQERDEHLLYVALRQKMAQWERVQKEELEALNGMYAQYDRELGERIALEIGSYRNRHAKKALIKRIVEDSKKELTAAFENPKKNGAYTSAVVTLFAHDKEA